MPSISAEFSHWDGDRAYINYHVDGFKLGVHYYTCAVKWRPDPYGVYYRSCGVIGTWGWTYDVRYKSKQGYVRGYKIDDGDITLTLAVVVDVILKNYGVCWEGDYHPEWVDASIDVYIPKKTIPCTQSFKAINKLTKEPMPGFAVTIFELPYPECITGSDGMCSIPNLQKGKTYEIVVNKEGYYTGGGTFKVCDGEIVFEIEEPCYVEGERRCVENDLYQCIGYKWEMIEAGSLECIAPCMEGTHETLELCPDGITERRWKDCINGKWVKGSRTCPECYPEDKHEVIELCPDGTEKRWRDCINGKWVENSQVCPCYPEGAHETLEMCPDGITDKRWRDCVTGGWVYNYRICPKCYPEGKHDVLEVCPDGITEKRWFECIGGEWKYKTQKCPPVDGDRKCIGSDLHEYRAGEWVLIEERSIKCLPCPIMCVCMGTPLVDSLGPLRQFRDVVLRRFRIGRRFVSYYYDHITPVLSPIILKMRRKKYVF